jgi:hypothetical protein
LSFFRDVFHDEDSEYFGGTGVREFDETAEQAVFGLCEDLPIEFEAIVGSFEVCVNAKWCGGEVLRVGDRAEKEAGFFEAVLNFKFGEGSEEVFECDLRRLVEGEEEEAAFTVIDGVFVKGVGQRVSVRVIDWDTAVEEVHFGCGGIGVKDEREFVFNGAGSEVFAKGFVGILLPADADVVCLLKRCIFDGWGGGFDSGVYFIVVFDIHRGGDGGDDEEGDA